MINVAIALNRIVVPQTCVLLNSLCVSNPENDIDIYVLHSELSDDDFGIMGSVIKGTSNIRLISVIVDKSRLPQGLPTNVYWSIEMYYRLMLAELLPESLDRILYLDVDMIVNKDISDFYNIDFGDSLLAVSRDQEVLNLLEEEKDIHPKRYEEFHDLMDKGMVYFCSGMILFNISAMRKEYTFRYYMDRFSEISDWVVLPDQDLLNYVHYQDVVFVDETKYGLFAQTAHKCGVSYDEVMENTAIIHFTGGAKPWTVNLIRYDIEKIWWDYAKDTPYYYALLENVFIQSVESTLVESTVEQLKNENADLKKLIGRMSDVMKRIGVE